MLLQVEANTQETVERRRRRQEDVQKQMAFRKFHGYDVSQGMEPWPLPEKAVRGLRGDGDGEGIGGGEEGGEGKGERWRERESKRKVWLGIW